MGSVCAVVSPHWTGALDQAMLLGSADILLTELTGLLTPAQAQPSAAGGGLPGADDPR